MRGFSRAASAAAFLAAPTAFTCGAYKQQQQQQQESWRRSWLSRAAAARCAVRTPQQHRLFVWGSRLAFPGGAAEDVKTPTEAHALKEFGSSWRSLSFGPHFGAALTGDGRRCVVWGSLQQQDKPPEFVAPFEVPLPRAAAAAADVQCSSAEVFVLDAEGRVFVIDDALLLLQQHYQQQQQQQQQQQFRQLSGLPVRGLLQSDFITSMAIGAEHAAFVSSEGRLFVSLPPCCAATLCLLPLLLPLLLLLQFAAAATYMGSGVATRGESCSGRFFGDDSKIQLALGDTRAQGGADVGTTYKERVDMAGLKAPMQRGATYGPLERHIQHEPMKTLKPPAAVSPEAARGVATAVVASDFSSLILYQDAPAEGGVARNTLLCCGEAAGGQCGRTLQQQQQTLKPVQLPASLSPPRLSPFVSAVSCGSAHCIAAINQKSLVGWGSSDKGQVGIGSRASKPPALRDSRGTGRQARDRQQERKQQAGRTRNETQQQPHHRRRRSHTE
ncbi:hypothetical protein Efla_002741 [Eimeria flavescens]